MVRTGGETGADWSGKRAALSEEFLYAHNFFDFIRTCNSSPDDHDLSFTPNAILPLTY